VARSAPQLITLLAGLVGVVLFAITLSRLDLDSTLASVRRLGAWLPIALIPGAAHMTTNDNPEETIHILREWLRKVDAR
jgi:hypothetical protein